MEEGHYKGNTKVGVAQLIRDHRGLWAMGGQDLILGYGEIRCGELHCSQIYRPGLRKVAHPCLVRFLVHLTVNNEHSRPLFGSPYSESICADSLFLMFLICPGRNIYCTPCIVLLPGRLQRREDSGGPSL